MYRIIPTQYLYLLFDSLNKGESHNLLIHFKNLGQLTQIRHFLFASYFPLFQNDDHSLRQNFADSQKVKKCKSLKASNID